MRLSNDARVGLNNQVYGQYIEYHNYLDGGGRLYWRYLSHLILFNVGFSTFTVVDDSKTNKHSVA